MRLFVLLALAGFVSSLGCGVSRVPPGQPPIEAEYHIAPPDLIRVTVRPEPIIERELTVRPDGRISMDLIGEVDVAGRTVSEVREDVAQRLKEFIVAPDVTVAVIASNSRQFFVFGEVLRPGAYPLIGDVTAVQALAAASGPTRFASLSSARLVRPREDAKQVYGIDFKRISIEGDATTNYELQPGDIIFVPPNASARIGYAIHIIFFPLQQIIGLGGGSPVMRTVGM
jgi:polysaccharide export outer membrane protein